MPIFGPLDMPKLLRAPARSQGRLEMTCAT